MQKLVFHLAPRMAKHCNISVAMVADESVQRSYTRSCILKVDGYSRARTLLKNDEYLTSPPFSVGGHNWAVTYYPNGSELCPDYISIFLHLRSAHAEGVKANFTFSLLDENGEPVPSYTRNHGTHTFSRKAPNWGNHNLMKKAKLERSEHLKDDCLTIRCDVTIMTEILGEEETRASPDDLHRHLGDLLESKDAADLTFQVGGEEFPAHRCVLVARSSVFKAELLGAMEESSSSAIKIYDMDPDVFKALLHFIYTNKVSPVIDVAMASHLLVAADRYNIGSLKQICEEKLCCHIDSNMVATSLAIAEQHGFHRLKEACLQFLASPSNLEAMMSSNGYEHLKSSCPSVLKEIIARILPAEWNAAKDIIMSI
ncbi:BTB/POZ and MATH domain-containing protein 2-like [Triticum urartu]|uniref:BTB/POZ and MATH domain-containing protein 2-like n=1 Tax=Triticum urartu TaxID=4572 RepID=UPI00204447BA|nr:BTB/POZ and MATH domain-containing protein 2-like [Triticum urartu]